MGHSHASRPDKNSAAHPSIPPISPSPLSQSRSASLLFLRLSLPPSLLSLQSEQRPPPPSPPARWRWWHARCGATPSPLLPLQRIWAPCGPRPPPPFLPMRRRRHAGRGANPGPFLPLHRIWATSRRPSLPRLLNSARLHLGGRDLVEDGAIGAGATDLRAAGPISILVRNSRAFVHFSVLCRR